MSKVFIRPISKKLFLVSLIIITLILSGCQTSWFSDIQSKKVEQSKIAAPPQPVVVDGLRTSYADLVERTSPAVVQISVSKKAGETRRPTSLEELFKDSPLQQPPGQQSQPEQRVVQGFGSGVIVKKDGTILTNHHVIEDAQTITVTMNDNKTYDAKIVGSDPPSDLAVIKIEGDELPFLELGNSDVVRIGDIVLAIGNPLGIGQSVTSGIISAKGRHTGISDGSFEDFLQTDAAINRGNSGGALINLKGELIGINSQILSPSREGGNIGIGFSIPSNMAKNVLEQLIENGKVKRGLLGVSIQDITSDDARALDLENTIGVLVSDVRKDGAADKAGVKRGDVITAINGETVSDGNTLRNKIAGTKPNTEIKLTLIRDGEKQELNATLDEFKSEGEEPEISVSKKQEEDKSEKSGKLGLSLQKLTPEISKELKIPMEVKGLIVTDVVKNGAADVKGIRKGDVIMEINQQTVENVEDVQSAIEKGGKKPVLLLISRRGQTTFVSIKIK